MTIADIHNYILFIERKQQLSLHTHAEIDSVLDFAQLELIDDYFRSFEFNQPIIDAFRFIKVSTPFSTNGDPVSLPGDYLHLAGLKTISYENGRAFPLITLVRMVKDDELSNALNSQLRPVSIKKPVATMENNKLILYPAIPQAGSITYIRRPAVPKFAYTQNGRQVAYDSATSQDMEFGEDYLNKIIYKALFILGVNLQDNAIMQAAQMKEQ